MEPRDDAILRISTLENGKKRLSCKPTKIENYEDEKAQQHTLNF